MKKWEYYHFKGKPNNVEKDVKFINEMAEKQGWELHSTISPVGLGSGTHTLHYILKRQRE